MLYALRIVWGRHCEQRIYIRSFLCVVVQFVTFHTQPSSTHTTRNEMLSLLVLSVSVLILLLLWRKRHCGFRLLFPHSPALPCPPGPPASLLFGNLLRLPTEHMWLTLMDWGSQYGDVLGLHMGVLGQRIVVLNSLEAVKDLLVKRSGSYSGRPKLVMLMELCVDFTSFCST